MDLALKNLKFLMYHKAKLKQIKSNQTQMLLLTQPIQKL